MRCVFCDDAEVHSRIIVENEYARAFPSNKPIVPGHVLIVPKRHAALVGDLSREEIMAVFELREQIAKALQETFSAQGFNSAWNEGEHAGQSIPHFHLHIVPRKKGDSGITKYEPRDFLYRPGSRRESSQQELREIAAFIRSAI